MNHLDCILPQPEFSFMDNFSFYLLHLQNNPDSFGGRGVCAHACLCTSRFENGYKKRLSKLGSGEPFLVEACTACPNEVHSQICGYNVMHLAKSTWASGATFSHNALTGTGRKNKLIGVRAQDVTPGWQDSKGHASASNLSVLSLNVTALLRPLLLMFWHPSQDS